MIGIGRTMGGFESAKFGSRVLRALDITVIGAAR
jgi:hypothetical protein